MAGDRRLRILNRLVGSGAPELETRRLCEVCAEITGMSGAGLMLMSGDVPRGAVCTTDGLSAHIEQWQDAFGEGPCVDAYRDDRPVLEPNLAHPVMSRWLAFAPPAVEAGVRAVFGFPLQVGAVGTTTLFAALNIASGQLIGKCFSRHRHEEFLVFLRLIDHEVEKNKQIHIILDNYATHKHEDVRNWLAKHKRFHLHFTPTSSSWLNLVERWFRDITTNRIRRGSFGSVVALIDAIEEYIAHNNDNPKPFIWTKTAGEIITKVRRGRVALEAVRESRVI